MTPNSRSAGRAALKYDAKGRVVQKKKKSGIGKFFLFYFLPYVVINAIVFTLVIASPRIVCTDPVTKDYRTATVSINVKSLLPLKNISANVEGQEIPLTKEGSGYTAAVTSNGNLAISAKSINGMQKITYIPVNILDDVPPEVNSDSVYLQNGILEFDVVDNQSGVDFDSIYGIDSDGDNVKPTAIDKESGHITFSLKAASVEVHISDLAGNDRSVTFTLD